MARATDLFVWGMVSHLICDWLLQNAWMSDHKASLRGPAAYVHAGIQTCGLLLVFPVPAALLLGLSHLLIDTRRPLQWWREFYGQTAEGPMAPHVAIWSDQVLHLTMIAVATWGCI